MPAVSPGRKSVKDVNALSRAVLTRAVLTCVSICGILSMVGAAPAHAGGASTAARALPSMPGEGSLERPLLSPDGSALLLSGPEGEGVYLLERASGTLLRLTHAPSSGGAFRFSPDGQRIGLKQLELRAGAEQPLQTPWIYDRSSGEMRALSAPSQRVGIPSFARDGRIAYTLDRTLLIADSTGKVLSRWDLEHYVNQAVLSPDGRFVLYNGRNEALWMLELSSGRRIQLTPEGKSVFEPQWSPDGARVLVSSVGGGVRVVALATGEVLDIADAHTPTWHPDSQSVLVSRQELQPGQGLVKAELVQVRLGNGPGGMETGSVYEVLTSANGQASSPQLSPDGKTLLWKDLRMGALLQASLAPHQANPSRSGVLRLGAPSPLSLSVASAKSWSGRVERLGDSSLRTPEAVTAATVEISGVPYMHQLYDSRDDFDGNWACNATSAIMTLAYYEVIPPWSCTASWPSSHTSPYCNYISEKYTFNGMTFDIGSESPDGVLEYGGYGYIVQGDWEDTKGHMAEYIGYHGVESSVDWSPTWSKLQAEVQAGQPFVLLNSLTSSGHYIVTVGYLEGQYTAVYNDPYGDKNEASYPNYNGEGARYDWPGYNNGYKNLNNAWCFIYSRGEVTPPVPQTGNLVGYVRETDIYTGAPIAGATVTITGGATATTDANGYYKFTGLTAGTTYAVSASAPCYATASTTKTIQASIDNWGSMALDPIDCTGGDDGGSCRVALEELSGTGLSSGPTGSSRGISGLSLGLLGIGLLGWRRRMGQ